MSMWFGQTIITGKSDSLHTRKNLVMRFILQSRCSAKYILDAQSGSIWLTFLLRSPHTPHVFFIFVSSVTRAALSYHFFLARIINHCHHATCHMSHAMCHLPSGIVAIAYKCICLGERMQLSSGFPSHNLGKPKLRTRACGQM